MKTSPVRNFLLTCSALAFSALAATAAQAQDEIAATGAAAAGSSQDEAAATTDAEAGYEEILVTARRREESLIDTPISVSALGGDQLQQLGVSDVQTLQYHTPSLSITSSQSQRNTVAFALRGQRTQETQLFSDPPVGTYFAEVVQPRPWSFGQTLFDLQSVQVLKGVQGTLFGRNMTGGAVLVEPRRPELGVFGGEIIAQIGNYDLRDVTAALNVPLGDWAALRVAGRFHERDGWSREVTTGRRYDNQNYDAFRASLLVEPFDGLENHTIFDWFDLDERGTASFLTSIRLPSVLSNYETLRGFGLIDANIPAQFAEAQALFRENRFTLNMGAGEGGNLDVFGLPFERISNWGITNRTVWEISDSLTLKNIFGYRDIEREIVQDYDGIPAFLITPYQSTFVENVSEELQLQGQAFDNRLTYIIGGYYFEEQGSDGSLANTLPELNIVGSGQNARTTDASLFVTANPGVGYSRTLAAYLAGTFAITDELSLSAGIRYTRDKRRITVSPSLPNLGRCSFDIDAATPGTQTVPIDQCSFTNSVVFEEPTYDLTLQWEPSSAVTTYASYRRGFRAGGFSTRATSFVTLEPFLPEFVDEYEIGLKTNSRVGPGRLQTTLALFRQDGTNVQKQRATFVNGNVFTVVDNTARQRNQGFEFEATLTLPHFTLTGFWSNVDVDILEGRVVVNGVPEFEQRGTPRNQVGLTAIISPPIFRPEVGELNVIAGISHRSEIYLDDFEIEGLQPSYQLVNARIELNNIAGSGFSAALWANNLLDETYRIGVLGLIAEGLGFQSSVFGEPRMYGAEVSFRF